MADREHTPGPWKCVAPTAILEPRTVVIDGNGRPVMVLDVDFSERDGVTYIDGVAVRLWPEDRALIEAAPDLLAACEDIVAGACPGSPTAGGHKTVWFGADRLKAVRAAIAKATK